MDLRVSESSGTNLKWRQSNLEINLRLLKKRLVPTFHVEFWEAGNFKITSHTNSLKQQSEMSVGCEKGSRAGYGGRENHSPLQAKTVRNNTTAVWPMAGWPLLV